MTTKERIVRALLYLYPARWRREYGPELADLLLSQLLGARGVADVLLAALRQRLRFAEPWAILGTVALGYILAELSGLLPGTSADSHRVIGMVQPSGITFPTYRVAAMDTDYYTQVLIVCGAWTAFRDAGSYSRPAWSAVKLTLLAGWPIVIAGLLITDVRTGPPSVLEVATAPILSLPMYWVYGYLGGYIGRGLRSFTRWIAKRPAATT